jgi:type III secretion protein J
MNGHLRRYRLAIAAIGAAAALGCQSTVIDDLSEEQANQVTVALNSGAIAAKKISRGGPDGKIRYRIEVASDEITRALSVLQDSKLPARSAPGFNEVYQNVGIVPTATEERARFSAALGGELERSIESLEGVVEARVHIALPESCVAALDGPRPKPRASVLIKRRNNTHPIDETTIRSLVTGAVQDMEPAQVAVIQIAITPLSKIAPELVRIGPVTVTRASVTALKELAAAVLLLDIILAIALVILTVRLRRVSGRARID